MAVHWLALLLAAAVVSAQPQLDEYRVKAAFVFRFPQFVDWPATAFDGGGNARLCVVRPNPFGGALSDLVRGESLKGRPLQLVELTAGDRVDGCHVLAIAGRDDPPVQAMLRQALGRPILTVGDSDRFLDAGGIIGMRVVDRKVRFDISLTNARRAGLQISSQLLGLAMNVRGGGRP